MAPCRAGQKRRRGRLRSQVKMKLYVSPPPVRLRQRKRAWLQSARSEAAKKWPAHPRYKSRRTACTHGNLRKPQTLRYAPSAKCSLNVRAPLAVAILSGSRTAQTSFASVASLDFGVFGGCLMKTWIGGRHRT